MQLPSIVVFITLLVSDLTTLATPEPIGKNSGECVARGLARYNVSFQGFWSQKLFPKMYPLYRPPAQWSKLVGRSHSVIYSLWEEGSPSSKSVRKFAEEANTFGLDGETQGKNGILDVFTAPRVNRGDGSTSSGFFVDAKHHKVSLMLKIIPSPDWFVGVSGLDLCTKNQWVDRYSVDLHPMDAGTDQGLTFTSPNWPEPAAQPIQKITSREPSHPASPFFYADIPKLPSIGRLVFKRLRTYGVPNEQQSNYVIDNTTDNDKITPYTDNGDTPLPCLVSKWGGWGPCSKACGFGVQSRHRTIIQHPLNGGNICPPLVGEKMCGSLMKCYWKKPMKSTFKWSFGK